MTPSDAPHESPDGRSQAVRSPVRLGRFVFGSAGLFLGAIGLFWDDFAVDWQHVSETAPLHGLLACLVAAVELLAGMALFWPPTARAGAAVLTGIFAIFALLWVPPILVAPGVYGGWGNFFEQLSAALGGATLVAALAPPGSAWAGRARIITRFFGICPISFGLVHFTALAACASWVPAWIPPGQMFWATAVGVCFFLAAAALLTGFFAGLAARLLTAMIVGFGVLIWLPKLMAAPHDHFVWSGNGINLALAGAAWVVADALCGCRSRAVLPQAAAANTPTQA